MAKIKKEEEVAKTSQYDFILPLEPHELKSMWDDFTDGKEIVNFRGVGNRLQPAEYVYYNMKKLMSYDTDSGQWSAYIPEGANVEDYNYKFTKAKRHWKQFEEYARKREYALSQNRIEPLIVNDQPEAKLNGFWGE
mgnify:CR=1 FL=1